MNNNLSKHFKASETSCNCNCGQNVDPVVNVLLELVRAWADKMYGAKTRIKVSSGSRCVEWNKHEGGDPNSKHIDNIAVDFVVEYFTHNTWWQVPTKVIYDFLDDLFPTSLGLGLYDNFNHMDGRFIKARWDKRTNK